jgi:hypothetical protein
MTAKQIADEVRHGVEDWRKEGEQGVDQIKENKWAACCIVFLLIALALCLPWDILSYYWPQHSQEVIARVPQSVQVLLRQI